MSSKYFSNTRLDELIIILSSFLQVFRPKVQVIEDSDEEVEEISSRNKTSNRITIEDITPETPEAWSEKTSKIEEITERKPVITDATEKKASRMLIEDVTDTSGNDTTKPLIKRIYEENAKLSKAADKTQEQLKDESEQLSSDKNNSSEEKELGDPKSRAESKWLLGELNQIAESNVAKKGVLDFGAAQEEDEETRGLSDAEKILKISEKSGSLIDQPAFDPDLDGLD